MSRRPSVPIALGLVATLGLGACGASEPVPAAGGPTGSSSPSAGGGTSASGGTRYPITLDNCGTQVTLDRAPSKVVSLDQDATEIMLSLGLADRLVGTASWTDPVLPSLADANAKVTRLADNAPTYEVVMGTDPDFVAASFGRHFAQGGVAPRARFAETGIDTYLSPTDCDNGRSINGGGKRTKPLTVDALHQEIRELARVFDVAPRGEQLIASLTEREAKALEGVDAEGKTIAYWFADTKTPYVASDLGAPGFLTRKIKAKNVFTDVPDDWTASTWETVVEKNPDVLVLGDLQRDRFPGDRLDDKVTFLKTDPLTKTMPAVQNQRFVSLHGSELNPSIRYVDGLEKLGDWWRKNGANVD
ncbi:ABC transporter substrate-binding protein [Agilicoccus flavus]|uniref:ABC transporter substrate-binding protein n=1 Tax=Agilicoccus flavus TaxID=2775968 RepID=UPI001CF6C7BA|nr:ABC transporter substrate-binding protein [Agilicoccus flavus]